MGEDRNLERMGVICQGMEGFPFDSMEYCALLFDLSFAELFKNYGTVCTNAFRISNGSQVNHGVIAGILACIMLLNVRGSLSARPGCLGPTRPSQQSAKTCHGIES